MTIYFGKNTLSIYRDASFKPGLCSNIGYGYINRIDRETIGVAYIVAYIGGIVIDYSRKLRDWDCPTVSERGVW